MGLTKSRGRYATLCIPDSIYGLTLAWVTSENSTMLLESDSSWLTLAGPYPMLSRLSAPVSGVDCPCQWFHANPLLLASLCPAANCSRPGRVVNSLSRPLPTSGYGEISGPRILCLVSRQNRQRNHLLWQPTHIVLHVCTLSLKDPQIEMYLNVTVPLIFKGSVLGHLFDQFKFKFKL